MARFRKGCMSYSDLKAATLWFLAAMAELPPDDEEGPSMPKASQSLPMTHLVTPQRRAVLPPKLWLDIFPNRRLLLNSYNIMVGDWVTNIWFFGGWIRGIQTLGNKRLGKVNWGMETQLQRVTRHKPSNAVHLIVSKPFWLAKLDRNIWMILGIFYLDMCFSKAQITLEGFYLLAYPLRSGNSDKSQETLEKFSKMTDNEVNAFLIGLLGRCDKVWC